MLLAVDAGNSHTVFGLFDGDRLEADWRIATRKEMTADEVGVLVQALFDRAAHDEDTVAHASAEHRKILEALLDGDLATAREALSGHILGQRAYVARLFEALKKSS